MKKQGSTSKPKVEFKGYLNVNLTVEQDKQFDEWFPLQNIQISDIGILCNNGYKFALCWDNFHNGVVASLYANEPKQERAGWILTAWAESAEVAIGMLFYKHYVVCEEEWERFMYSPERMSRTRG